MRKSIQREFFLMSRKLVLKEQKSFVTIEKEVANLRYFVWIEAIDKTKTSAVKAYQFNMSDFGDYNGF